MDYMHQMEERIRRADEFLESRGYTVQSHHGQRISTNMNVLKKYPEIESNEWNEIFIGRLPRDLFEDELLSSLEKIGEVYKIRYMMDFSRSNRGFCFVKYVHIMEAMTAVGMLDGAQLRPNRPPIGVRLSFNNKCLYFGNLPCDCTEERLIKALTKHEIHGIVAARMHAPRWTSRGKFCYVYFESHDAATKARRELMPGHVELFKKKLTLDWAKSEIPPHITMMYQQLKQNQALETTKRQLRQLANGNLLS